MTNREACARFVAHLQSIASLQSKLPMRDSERALLGEIQSALIQYRVLLERA